jgi:hypothetical protein
MVTTRHALRGGLVLSMGLGCGPSSASSDSSTSTATTSSTTTAGGSTGKGDDSTSFGASDGDSDSSGSGASSSSDDGGTSGTTSTGEPLAPIAYCADTYVGGLDRANIWKRDETADLCVLVRLINGNHPWDGPLLDVPAPYDVERIVMSNDAAGCGSDEYGGVYPSAAEGSVGIIAEPLAMLPDFVDIDATLYFDPIEPWIPEQVIMRIDRLAVGYPCDHETGDWVPAE